MHVFYNVKLKCLYFSVKRLANSFSYKRLFTSKHAQRVCLRIACYLSLFRFSSVKY
jgi:hypothetical protein